MTLLEQMRKIIESYCLFTKSILRSWISVIHKRKAKHFSLQNNRCQGFMASGSASWRKLSLKKAAKYLKFKTSTLSFIFVFIWCQEAMLNCGRFSIQKEVEPRPALCAVLIVASLQKPQDISFEMPTWEVAELDTNLVTFKRFSLFQYLSPSLSHRRGCHVHIRWRWIAVCAS